MTSKEMFVTCVRVTPPLPKVDKKKRVQKLKKTWRNQKQAKTEEKDLFRELFWEERLRPVEYDLDFDDLFDTF